MNAVIDPARVEAAANGPGREVLLCILAVSHRNIGQRAVTVGRTTCPTCKRVWPSA